METVDADYTLMIELATGEVLIQLFPDVAPEHAERIITLARAGEYDNVAFHRVIDGFMAQTGDVQYGDLEDGYIAALAGFGGSDLPDLEAEFSDIPYERGIVGMARSTDPDSANSQFFIMFDDNSTLDGRYTVVGEVISGMEHVDQIKRGVPGSGAVTDPDRMIDVEVAADHLGLGLTEAEAQEVALLYEAGLDRDGEIDLPGLNFWIDAREGAFTMTQIAQFFLDSAEFAAGFGDPDTLTDAELVDQLYFNVLGREGDADGVAFWNAAVARDDFSRADLLYAFATSVENAETLEFVETLTEVLPSDWAFV
ncbi:hypothetical protein LNKW23_43490 [Paralimibaculum aggregatum]|uniref:peptidylprolyl isomerase n=2 Tax=Paralimibaculum aggregatum TaxID=3036245 RepID=A0ABQ6LSS0_9RHOB|nr:hypothetical protein LNKW23_43490 [Limibaculum sp. NKW23]